MPIFSPVVLIFHAEFIHDQVNVPVVFLQKGKGELIVEVAHFSYALERSCKLATVHPTSTHGGFGACVGAFGELKI